MQSKKVFTLAAVAAMALPLLLADGSWAFGHGLPWWHAFTAPFVHVNVFHYAACMWCLVPMRPKGRETLTAYAVCALAGLLLCRSCAPTLGLSGFLFAVAGLRFRFTRRYALAMVPALLTGLIPGVAGLYHLLCFCPGLALAGLRQMKDHAHRYGF